MTGVLVALAAGIGALTRYVVDEFVEHRTRGALPLGTMLVNVTGAFALGVVTGLAIHHGFDADTATVPGDGFAGGYTTLSTWAWESLALGEAGEWSAAVIAGAGSVALGLAASAAGLGVGLL